jgi:hypothetical protein
MLSIVKRGQVVILALTLHGQQTSPMGSGGISGVVRNPDGNPNGGAKISAITECPGMPFNLVNDTAAASDGSFHIPAFKGAECNAVRLYAEKPEDLWLKTGPGVFFSGENGSTPFVNVAGTGPPVRADIKLGMRGALVNLRVKDKASGKFIWAEFQLHKIPPATPGTGSMYTATGKDGSPVPMLLPAGEYRVSIQQYACDTVDYFARKPPTQTFAVATGERTVKEFDVDVRKIQAANSYSNPHGHNCRV